MTEHSEGLSWRGRDTAVIGWTNSKYGWLGSQSFFVSFHPIWLVSWLLDVLAPNAFVSTSLGFSVKAVGRFRLCLSAEKLGIAGPCCSALNLHALSFSHHLLLLRVCLLAVYQWVLYSEKVFCRLWMVACDEVWPVHCDTSLQGSMKMILVAVMSGWVWFITPSHGCFFRRCGRA